MLSMSLTSESGLARSRVVARFRVLVSRATAGAAAFLVSSVVAPLVAEAFCTDWSTSWTDTATCESRGYSWGSSLCGRKQLNANNTNSVSTIASGLNSSGSVISTCIISDYNKNPGISKGIAGCFAGDCTAGVTHYVYNHY